MPSSGILKIHTLMIVKNVFLMNAVCQQGRICHVAISVRGSGPVRALE